MLSLTSLTVCEQVRGKSEKIWYVEVHEKKLLKNEEKSEKRIELGSRRRYIWHKRHTHKIKITEENVSVKQCVSKDGKNMTVQAEYLR